MYALFIKIAGRWMFEGFTLLKVAADHYERTAQAEIEAMKESPIEDVKVVYLEGRK